MNNRTCSTNTLFALVAVGALGACTVTDSSMNQPNDGGSGSSGSGSAGSGSGSGSGSDSAPPVDASPSVKRVFVTEHWWTGDLATAGNGTGMDPGVAGADALCNAEATAFSLGGTWTAWISSFQVTAKDRVIGGPWYLVDGTTLVTSSVTDLLANGPDHAIDMFPGGDPDTIGLNVWTGTDANGNFDTDQTNCASWTSDANNAFGEFGDDLIAGNAIRPKWNTDFPQACGSSGSDGALYCFEN
jgi:hypothetical protein